MNNPVRLVSVYSVKDAKEILYRLLSRRPKRVNISHRKMPSPRQHAAFVRSKPYQAWYLIRTVSGEFAGGIYLSKAGEIGIFLFKEHQGRGYGKQAVEALMKKHRSVKRFLANVSPNNPHSINFFKELRFKHVQNTYERL